MRISKLEKANIARQEPPYLGNLLDDEVVGGPHAFVGAGGVDFHFGGGNLMEEIGGAPGIDELTAEDRQHVAALVASLRKRAVAAPPGR